MQASANGLGRPSAICAAFTKANRFPPNVCRDYSLGRRMVNREPFPGSDSTVTSPPCSLTI